MATVSVPALRAASSNPTIHNIPSETLGEIFLHVVPVDQDFEKVGRIRQAPERPAWANPPSFLAVSSGWRKLALSIPRLWQRVYFHVPPFLTKEQAWEKAADLETKIRRAGSLPLSLCITYDLTATYWALDKKGTMAPVLDVLDRYATRWETLRIQPLSPRLEPPPVQMLYLDKWSSLKRLSCPSRLYCKLHPPSKVVPWKQLTHLDISTHASHWSRLDVLKECQKLVWLSVQVPTIYWEHTGRPPASFWTLPELITFYLATTSASSAIRLFTLPSLRELVISELSGSYHPDKDSESLLGFFKRSACTLDKLEIRGRPLPAKEFVNVLAHQSCGSLTSLIISDTEKDERNPYSRRDVDLDVEFLKRLTLYRHEPLCIHLKVLMLEYRAKDPSLVSLDMVKSRISPLAGDSQLEFLCLDIEKFNDKEKLEEIIKQSGLEYSLYREGTVVKCKVWSDSERRFPSFS